MYMFVREDIEDIILGMADIVRENRELRYELKKMHKAQEEHEKFVDDLVKTEAKANSEFLKLIMENALMGGR